MDYYFFSLVNNLAGRHPGVDVLMRLAATYLPLAGVAILAGVWWWPQVPAARERARRVVMYAVLAVMVGLGANQVIGTIWFRPRPFAGHEVTLLLGRSPDPSFPSDHATFTTAMAALFSLARHPGSRVLWLVTVLVGFARVFCGTHYPGDILGGVGTGALAAGLVWVVRGRLEPAVAGVLSVLPGGRKGFPCAHGRGAGGKSV